MKYPVEPALEGFQACNLRYPYELTNLSIGK